MNKLQVNTSSSGPSFLVTIDTEEEGIWNDRFSRTDNTVRNIHGIVRFQELCDRFQIRPTYLVDAAVVMDDFAVGTLREIQDDHRAEIGTHVHPWCNPPLVEELNGRNSFLCNLPDTLQSQKIQWLTESIEQRFGRRPTSFRSGRYGLDIVGARILADLDYVVDSSVIPFSDFSKNGGPDFSSAPIDPYFIGENDLLAPAESGKLLEVPVTVGFNRRNFHRADAMRNLAAKTPLRQLKAVGMLDRLGIVQRIKFSPEQANAAQLKRLADVLMHKGAPCLVLMFHSSSLLPGLSPYVSNAAELEEFFGRLETIFDYCTKVRACRPLTLTDYALEFGQNRLPVSRSVPSVVNN